MAEQQLTMGNRVRLSIMMFFQYMLVAVWFVQLTAYLNDALSMTGLQMALIGSSMALGCLASPLIGMFADRHFSSERVLAVLNLATAVLLFLSSQVTEATPVFLFLLFAMLCYMPTWSLTNSIAMTHAPSEKFPQIRVFGSIGWVAAGLFSLVADKMFETVIDGTSIPLICGAAVALVGAVYALTLPHTPPPAKGQKSSVVDVLGLRSISLMKDVGFAVVVLGTLVAMLAFAAYWTYFSAFLKAKGFEYLTVTMNWGQFVEMGVMLLVPLFIATIGLKWTMVLGLAALAVRFGSFWLGNTYDMDILYYAGILVHGVIFGCFFVGGQIYIDRKAPKEMKAQAQGLIFLIAFGIGLLAGNFINGGLLEMGEAAAAGAKNWEAMWIFSTVVSVALLVLFALIFRDPVASLAAEKKEEAAEEVEEAIETAPAGEPTGMAVDETPGAEEEKKEPETFLPPEGGDETSSAGSGE